MFKLSFSGSDRQVDTENKSDKEWYNALQISPKLEEYNIESTSVNNFVCDNITLKYISPNHILHKLEQETDSNNSVLRAETSHSDLIPAEYEGGLKIWECTKDLINYLNSDKINFSNKLVLDLGCGAGLLGIYALLHGSDVDFQDYNEEVITYTTIPNVSLNLTNYFHLFNNKKCKFFAGDWQSFMSLNTIKYDYILTSETIYNPENYQKLYEIFANRLKDDGVIYLAAKTYYFGVGGGVRQFEGLLNKNNFFNSTICWKTSGGVQREILKISKQ